MKKYVSKLLLLFIIILAVVVYFTNQTVNGFINNIIAMFATGDFSVVRGFIEQYGMYAMLVSAGLMVLQSLLAPLPAFLITFANANLFGWWQGAILSWSSAMLGAVLCFFVARILGRDIIEKLTSKAGLQQIDSFFDKYGKHSILIARLLPFISFDIVSYAAGLTSMRFWAFFVATGIGQLPATIIYSYVGGMLSGGAQLFVMALLILFALSVLVVLLRQIYISRNQKSDLKNEA